MKSAPKDTKKNSQAATPKLSAKDAERELWNVTSSIIDSVNASIVAAVNLKKLPLSAQDVALISTIVKSAAETAMTGAVKSFLKKL